MVYMAVFLGVLYKLFASNEQEDEWTSFDDAFTYDISSECDISYFGYA